MSHFVRTGLLLGAMGFLAGCRSPAADSPVEAATVSRLAPPRLNETSGLAASRRDPALLWAHNDSGNWPHLYALDLAGNQRGRIMITNAANHDWEDLATFELDGRAWILIADVGDNQSARHNTELLLLREPHPSRLKLTQDLRIEIEVRIPVRFPDGPRDCEAVAVDPIRREILLVSKRTNPPAVYRLPLVVDPAAAAATPPAERLVGLSHLPQPDALQWLTPTPAGRWRAQPTALDITPDGTTALLLTYGDAVLYRRDPAETWTEAFARKPLLLPAHQLPQAEAAAFTATGQAVLITSEGDHAPLLHYPLAPFPPPAAAR